MMRQPRDVIQDWINRVNDEGRGLTAWEEQFMESITEQFDRSSYLSDAQIDVLERIYTEKTP